MRQPARHGLPGILLVALLLIPATAAAQASFSLTPFGGIDRSLPDDPTVVGLGTGIYFGHFGLRASGSAALRDYQIGTLGSAYGPEKLFAYAGDLDIALKPARKAGAAGAFGPLDPLVFAGIGLRGERFAEAADFETHTVASLGTALSMSLFSRFRAEVELRRVVPMDEISKLVEDQSVGAWEYRAGLSIRFGKGNLRPVNLPDVLRTGAPSAVAGVVGSGGSASAGRTVVSVPPGTLLHTANGLLGTPYVWGGNTPAKGFDCSGFVQYTYGQHGARLPRTSREMWLVGEHVPGSASNLEPGDLMFFAGNDDGRITHVGLYAGNNMMLHATKSGGGVAFDDLSTPRGRWFRDRYVGGRRILGVPIEGVEVAEVSRIPGGLPALSVAERPEGLIGSGLAAFMAAAGLENLSDLAKQLYASDEQPDPPDDAPERRW